MKIDNNMEVKIPDLAPECLRCVHYEVTWETAFPRACKVFGIKCRNLPSREVFLSTGKHCFTFEERKEPEDPLPDSGGGSWA